MDWTYPSLIVAVLILLINYIWKKLHCEFDHFKKQGIPYIKPSFFFGSTGPLLRRNVTLTDFVLNVCNEYKDASVIGVFDQKLPIYFIKDPEMIKKIAVKDFEHFIDHRFIVDGKHDPYFGSGLFSLQGQKWKDMRSTLSPVFTGSKMRQMFDLIPEVGEQMAEYFKTIPAEDRIFEMKDIFSKFGLDTIASTNFGVKINSLREKDNLFYKKATQFMDLNNFSTHMRFMVMMYMRWLANLLKLRAIPAYKSVFFEKLVEDTEKERERQGIVRPDLMQLMMQIKKGQLEKDNDSVEYEDSAAFATVQETDLGKVTKRKWTDQELLAQAFIFFFGGFDTSANLSSFIAYELALNPDIQEKLVEEVDKVTEELQGKKLTYEVLQKMKYLDMILSEALRRWAPSDATDRVCAKDYKITNDQGEEVLIEKGSLVWLPIIGLHMSEKYFENPTKFDPERFNDENKHKINSGAYLPFGIGPRNCIGSRYALMQVRAGFYYILRDFTFEKTAKTQIPVTLQKGFISKASENGIWLKLQSRKKIL